MLLRACRVPDREGLVDIDLRQDRIAAIVTHDASGRRTDAAIDVGGRVVTPGLVEAHIHLDKAFLSERLTVPTASVREAIRQVGEAKRSFTLVDISARARRVLDLAVAAGTTAMRAHVEVDPIVGLTGMEAMLALKAEYAPALELQLCAFAQEGILQAPGTEALLRRALQMGADLVGGCPYNDTDPRLHIDLVFRLAQAFDVAADFHVDFFDEPDHLHVREIIERTRTIGWQGRVAVGHLTELAALPPAQQDEIIAHLRDVGIGVICLPATDLYLMGRGDDISPRRGLTPVRRLLAAGVPVALASNNIRNPFTTVGTADLSHMAFLAAVTAHMGAPAELRQLVETVTTHPARILGLRDYGLAPGAHADLVVWDCTRVEEVVAALPGRVLVMRRGRVTVEHERRLHERWREPGRSTPPVGPSG
ncbi:MAG TPA: amidohydrolase family protein [Methylomirabilota bacterium]|nr:amidohydrolase family protein [Methylomirabilota bacterium]